MMSKSRELSCFSQNLRTCALLAAAGALLGVSAAQAALVNVDPTKAGGDYIAGTGIPGDNFLSDSGGGVNVFLKPRARPPSPFSGQAILTSGSTFINPTDVGGVPLWNFDFQFTPREDDVVGGRNYTLMLEVDTDPGPGTDFTLNASTITSVIFDANVDPLDGSWDDSDGFFVNPGGGAWSSNDIDYVYSQSWRVGFGFLAGAELAPGDYLIRWTAISPEGNQLAQISATSRLIPEATTAVTLDATDSCLNASEGQVVVAINLGSPQVEISGGQFFMEYDETKLDFVSADVADPEFLELFEVVNEPAGTIDYAVSADFLGGSTGTTTSTTLATLTFNTLGDFTEEDALVFFRTHVPPTRVTEFGGGEILPHLADLGVVTKDSVAPVISIPGDITVKADAGLCTAVVTPGVATATDNVDATPNVVGTRDDGEPLDAVYPAGTTMITWTATDDCGNIDADVQTVTVEALSDLIVDVELDGVRATVDRCITFELEPTGGGAPIIVEETLSFVAGIANATVEIPCGDYQCISARDTLHTLRSRDSDDFGIAGTDYVADFTSSGDGDALLGGNFNDDMFIDILDFGVLIGQFLTDPGVPGGDTVCGTTGSDADASGNGLVDGGDFTFISTQFLFMSEDSCAVAPIYAGDDNGARPIDAVRIDEPVVSITLEELDARGLGHLASADLNGDGVLDQADIAAFFGGARPDHLADVTGDGIVDIDDLRFMKQALSTGDSAGDVNGDGLVDLADLIFVLERLGMVFDG